MSLATAPLDGDGGHWVHFALGEAVCAIPIAGIVGVRLFGEVRVRDARGRPAPDDGHLEEHLVEAERRYYAAWDFHTLLELGSVACSSWMLLNVRRGTRIVPLALRIGRCLAVERVGRVMPLPPAAFRVRSGMFRGVFDARHISTAPSSAGVGLSCDPSALLSERELDESLRRVEAIRRPR